MNDFEAYGRAYKAGRIAAALARLGATPEQVAALDDEGRRTAELAAQVHVSSDQTWDLVVRLVGSGLENDADPFRGLPR